MATKSTAGRNGGSAVIDEAATSEVVAQIQISRIAAETLRVPILGTTPLIVHRFSEKAKRQMLDAMQGKKTPKQPKNPDADYESAFYRFPDGSPDAFPSSAFKLATVEASRFYGKDVTKVGLRQFVFVFGEGRHEFVRIQGDPTMREDVVRVGRGGTDLRYRPEFTDWRTVLEVTYVTSALTRDSVLSLIDAAGMGVGVGEWRPEKDGTFGTYRIDPDVDVEVIG